MLHGFSIALILTCFYRGISLFYSGYGLLLFLCAHLFHKLSFKAMAKRLVPLGVFLLLPCLVFDLYLFMVSDPPSCYWDYDPDTLYRLRPHFLYSVSFKDNEENRLTWTLSTSELGIRDREFGKKKENEYRIVTLGDSYTMGVGLEVEDTFQRQLEVLLREGDGDKEVQVINCGVGAYAPWQERFLLQKVGFSLEPDLVILQLFPANDIEGAYLEIDRVLAAFSPQMIQFIRSYIHYHQLPCFLDLWIWHHSEIYRKWCRLTQGQGYFSDVLADLRFLPFADCKIPIPAVDRNPFIEPCLRDWYPELEEAWALYAKSIRGIQEDCQAYGIPLVAFVHGMNISLTPEFWETSNKNHPNTPYEMNKDIRLTQELFAEFAIPYVDITAALMAQPHRENLFYIHEGHFSPEGAKVVASTLADFLLNNFLETESNCNQNDQGVEEI